MPQPHCSHTWAMAFCNRVPSRTESKVILAHVGTIKQNGVMWLQDRPQIRYTTLFHPQPQLPNKTQRNPCPWVLHIHTPGSQRQSSGHIRPHFLQHLRPDLDHPFGRGRAVFRSCSPQRSGLSLCSQTHYTEQPKLTAGGTQLKPGIFATEAGQTLLSPPHPKTMESI